MAPRHLLSIGELSPEEIDSIVARAQEIKAGKSRRQPLSGKSVAMLFEKPSLRTRVSFHVAVHQLGGHSVYLGQEEVGLGTREPISDMTRALCRYVDCIVARVNRHGTLEEMARYATVPVINALSDWEHPCQALADMETVREHKGSIAGLRMAYVGDGNNVARSLCLAATALGASFSIASPPGYSLDETTVSLAQKSSSRHGARVETREEPQKAVAGADVVYTDVWTSMGQETEADIRRQVFDRYRLGPELLKWAKSDAILMHPMPAHYGEEVPQGMLEHPASVAFDQAENRLHAQKAVLEMLLGPSLFTTSST